MSWSTTPTVPQRTTGPAWTTTPPVSARVHGPGWFASLEHVVPLAAAGTLSAAMSGNFPLGHPRLAADGTLAAAVVSVKTITAAFTATGNLLASAGQRRATAVGFSAGTGLGCTINDGLSATITPIGGVVLIDGLSATISGGVFDGLFAGMVKL